MLYNLDVEWDVSNIALEVEPSIDWEDVSDEPDYNKQITFHESDTATHTARLFHLPVLWSDRYIENTECPTTRNLHLQTKSTLDACMKVEISDSRSAVLESRCHGTTIDIVENVLILFC